MNHQSQQSYLGAFYSLQLSQMGDTGFRTWLKESFFSARPAPKAPYFYNEDLERDTFGEVFAKIAPELGETPLAIARSGIVDALKQFPIQTGTYEGLFSLVRMAESLRLFDVLDSVYDILCAKLPKEPKQRHLPDTDIEIYSLRETLESLFRLAQVEPARLNRICEWAFTLLAAGMTPASLNPVLAPAFVLARRHVSQLNCSVAQMEISEIQLSNALRKGYYKSNSPFEGAYVFHKDGELYPYDIEGIFAQIDGWLRPASTRRALTLRGRFVRPLTYNPARPSATLADLSDHYNSEFGESILDVRAEELEGACA